MALVVRVVLAALAAYVVTGLVWAAGRTFFANMLADWPLLISRPWNSASGFVDWFVGQALAWPGYLLPIRGLWEILVASVYLATLWLVYRVAGRRSAPRRLKSSYPHNH